MTTRPVFLNAPGYVLGEHETPYAELPGFAERARQLRIVDRPELWGWGSVWRTDRDLAQLTVAAGLQVLETAGAADVVDAVVLCSTRFPGDAQTHGGFVGQIMAGLSLPDAAFTGVTLNRCTGLLAGIGVAEAFVSSGRYRAVLVITADRMTDDGDRLHPFALFSDGAAGCLVADAEHVAAGYEIVASASAHDNRDLDWTNQISADLARTVASALLKPAGIELAEVDALLHPNLFVPLLVTKERLAGFDPAQLFTGNVPRVGHCFAADPLINLVDRAGALRPGGHVMLAASVPGVRHGVLLRSPSSDRSTSGRTSCQP